MEMYAGESYKKKIRKCVGDIKTAINGMHAPALVLAALSNAIRTPCPYATVNHVHHIPLVIGSVGALKTPLDSPVPVVLLSFSTAATICSGLGPFSTRPASTKASRSPG
jgi:hypothetical protein